MMKTLPRSTPRRQRLTVAFRSLRQGYWTLLRELPFDQRRELRSEMLALWQALYMLKTALEEPTEQPLDSSQDVL